MATSTKFRPVSRHAQAGVNALEKGIIPDLRAHLVEKLHLPADAVERITNELRQKVYQALDSMESSGITDVMVERCRQEGVDLRDKGVRRIVQGAVKGVLKSRGLDTKIPGHEKEEEPLTVYVKGVRPPAPSPKPVTREGGPSLGLKPGVPEAAKTPLTAAKLPTQLPPAPDLPAKDPRRSSAQLASIRREPTVEKAFKAAAELVKSRYPAGTFPSLADFLADAYNDHDPDLNKNLRRKLEKLTRQFWDATDEQKASPDFETELEKSFLAGFGDKYYKQQHRDRTEAVKKQPRR